MGLWADTVLPTAARVGGVRLYPVTLGHAALLQRLDNGFAEAIPNPRGLGDVVVAAWVLSRHWQKAADAKGAASTRLWIALVTMAWGRMYPQVLGQMLRYHVSQWRAPEVEFPTRRKSDRGTEYLHALYLHRRRQFHENYTTAMEVPVRLAQLDFLADAEREGALTLCGAKLDRWETLAAEHADWDRQVRAEEARRSHGG